MVIYKRKGVGKGKKFKEERGKVPSFVHSSDYLPMSKKLKIQTKLV